LADDWSYGTRPHLHVIDFGDALRELREKTRPAYWQVVLKRLMYRAACAWWRRARAEAIVTGEAVGQVSSQTLTNLRAIETPPRCPCCARSSASTRKRSSSARSDIGTAALSEQVKEYCAIAPGHPVTAASVARVDDEDEDGSFDARPRGAGASCSICAHCADRPGRAVPLRGGRARRRGDHRLPARSAVPRPGT
jgi:tRNA uracil 4-sulfurtransferase